MKRKYLALAMMTTMVLSMTACGSSAPDSAQTAPAEGTEETPAEEAQETPAAASGDVVTINVGYENATTEPASFTLNTIVGRSLPAGAEITTFLAPASI